MNKVLINYLSIEVIIIDYLLTIKYILVKSYYLLFKSINLF